jgi:hypothetical protein
MAQILIFFANLPPKNQSIIRFCFMYDLIYTVEGNKLLEALADIAYLAGQKGFFSGDSRQDIAEFISWAKEFETMHDETNWDEVDYHDAIEAFTLNKLRIDAQ